MSTATILSAFAEIPPPLLLPPISYVLDRWTNTVLSVHFANSANFTPFAQRTQQLIKEQLGQAEDRTQLPDEYIELEKRVDALKVVHQKLLSVT